MSRTIALLTSIAYSLPNFRGTLIEALVARGHRVLAMAPDYDDRVRARVKALGAEPIDVSLSRAGISPARDAAGPITVEGPFARNGLYGAALARLTGRPVQTSAHRTGTSFGAACLFPWARANDTHPMDPGHGVPLGSAFDSYAARWRSAASTGRAEAG